MQTLLEPDDEVLIPAPDYPLWSAAVALNKGKAIYYHCRPQNEFMPDPEEIESLIGPRTRAIVLINPNNPTGAVYSKQLLQKLVEIAERHRIIIFSDEIYDQILYGDAIHTPTASLCSGTLCATFGGLSKVYRAAGYRTGWVYFSGDKREAGPYLKALELMASLRLCSNVPGQWAVQTALGGTQSIKQLTSKSGRLGTQRQMLIDSIEKSKYLSVVEPKGALYAFIGVNIKMFNDFNDRDFAMRLLEEKRVLVVPGSSFHVDYQNYFRATFLPDPAVIEDVFIRIESLLSQMARDTGKNKLVA
jgi:alanine-synthesizing transaminase